VLKWDRAKEVKLDAGKNVIETSGNFLQATHTTIIDNDMAASRSVTHDAE